ncbi:MAG: ABC transporter permease [Lacibacter sp.]
MRVLRFLFEKEFRQIFRDPAVLRMMLIMPVIQLVVLPLAADYEVKDVKLAVVDFDRSADSRRLVHKITASGYFQIISYHNSYTAALKDVEQDRADLVLQIPRHFERDLIRGNTATLFMAVNAINGVRANLGAAYLSTIIRNFNQDFRMRWLQFPRFNAEPRIEITGSNWFNVHMNYRQFMVPGILVILVTMVGAFLAALNIVREKEIGTIEQINVTPIRKHHFILGKLIPFWFMAQVVLALGLLIARVVYGVIPAGNIGLIFLFNAVYMLVLMGLGLLISTYVNTQQQAMLIAFFMMMVFILLSGLYTSIESMPAWAQFITRINPVTYFIEVMRMVVMKGSTLADISRHLFIMLGMAVVVNSWAVWSYRKRA